MKRTARFLSFLTLLAAVFTGCQREEADYELPGIRIGGPFTVDDATKKASYEASQELNVLNLNITATRDWTADIQWDADEVPWIAVTPDHGVASDVPQSVKVTILENPGFNRAKDIKFSINFDYKTLSVAQTGEKGEEVIGTLDNPYTVAGVIKYVKNLGSDVQSPQGVYVKGIVSQVTEEFSANFGNGTFYISDDGTTDSEQFYAYRVLYLGNRKWTARDAQVKVGDEVWVYGNVVNYKGNTPETVQNSAFVYSHNGNTEGEAPSGGGGEAKGTGTLDDPYNPAGANAAVAGLTWTSNDVYDKTGEVYVKGKISRIATNGTFTEGGTFGNASFYISEDGSSSDEFYAFRILYLGNKKFTSGQTDIKVGDEVVVCGKLMNYRGNTPETVAGEAYLYSLNGQGGSGTDPQPSGNVKAVTVAEFNAAEESQTQVYELVGTIGGSINTTYGNFDLTDDTGTVYVYGLTATDNGYGTKNDQSYGSLGLKEGDKIRIRGYRGSYNGKIEVVYAWFIEKVDGGTDPQPSGEVKAVTVAAFNAAEESQTQVYELVGTIGGSINTTYGNFDLTDDTGTVYVYGLTATDNGYGTKNDQSYASLGLKEGDKIRIRGYRGSYNGKIEVVYAWFIEKVDGGSQGGGDTPSGSSVSFSTNSGAQTWSAATDGTYGAGYGTTTQGLNIAYYKHTSTSNPVAPNANHVRVYKNSVLSVASADGKKIKKIVIGTAPNAGTTSYCFDMAVLEGGSGSATADKSALTVTWSGSASKVVLQTSNGQVRMEKITVEFE